MKNIFDKEVTNEVINRINKLSPETQSQWGKMDVSRMLAHCNVTYEMVYDNKHTKAKGLKKLMLNWFIKPVVVNEKPYKKNSPTAPEFKIVDSKVFDTEKKRLSDYIQKTQELGENHFEGKESNSFGKLNKNQWNNMFYKHLDHHLNQFGA
jgi:hypothetical protein|tara:strand:+ start:3422 stop:3874 length:453 start_codon:yes stop_codon:yes gene_type:complete